MGRECHRISFTFLTTERECPPRIMCLTTIQPQPESLTDRIKKIGYAAGAMGRAISGSDHSECMEAGRAVFVKGLQVRAAMASRACFASSACLRGLAGPGGADRTGPLAAFVWCGGHLAPSAWRQSARPAPPRPPRCTPLAADAKREGGAGCVRFSGSTSPCAEVATTARPRPQ